MIHVGEYWQLGLAAGTLGYRSCPVQTACLDHYLSGWALCHLHTTAVLKHRSYAFHLLYYRAPRSQVYLSTRHVVSQNHAVLMMPPSFYSCAAFPQSARRLSRDLYSSGPPACFPCLIQRKPVLLLGLEVVEEDGALLALLAPVADDDARAVDDFAGVAFAVEDACVRKAPVSETLKTRKAKYKACEARLLPQSAVCRTP